MNLNQPTMNQQLGPASLPLGLPLPRMGRSKERRTRNHNTTPYLTAKRLYDIFFSGFGLIFLTPLFLLIGLLVKLADRGPVFYRQRRIGQYGIPFLIWKFRTMVPNADKIGPPVTGEGDRRTTRLGRLLRRSKLDELPQLWNVFRGEMSLVGPRPEVPRYVEQYTPEQGTILQSKPGVTDLASLRFRNEEALLRASADTERFYVEQCLPRKLALNREYARRANLLSDTWILLQTVCPYWVGVLGLYGLVLTISFCLSYWLLRDFAFSIGALYQVLTQVALVTGLQLGCLLARRHCKGLLCYFGMPELRQVASSLSIAALLLLGLSLLNRTLLPAPNFIVVNFCLSLLAVSGFRLLLRLWRERAQGKEQASANGTMRVGIIGAGSLGAHLARSFDAQKRFGRTAVAFFDDDSCKWQRQLHEVPIVGMPECVLQGWCEKLDEIAIALPSASAERLQELTQLFEKTNLRVYTVSWPGHCVAGGLERAQASNEPDRSEREMAGPQQFRPEFCPFDLPCRNRP